MVFKRRTPRSYLQALGEFFYPKGGWFRASQYVVHRLRRLPDPAHKISRGIAAGVFVSFTPLFGFHFFTAAIIAWLMRGNILAAILGTFAGNPITFPIIATASVELGNWMLGYTHDALPHTSVASAFSYASLEIWSNIKAIFTPDPVGWHRLNDFFDHVFLPYLVGGIVPGVFAGLAAYFASRPLITAYQKSRIRRLKKNFAKRRAAIDAAKLKAQGSSVS